MKTNQGKQMNVMLWVLRVILAIWYISGGLYMTNNYGDLAKAWALNTLPVAFRIALGMLQILFALGLVLPKISHKLTFISAVCLSAISILGIALYVELVGLGILWGVVPATLAALIAWKKRR